MFKINKGITLIALVVTIVILLILAGITLVILLGDNGIITKTQESKKKNDIGREKEAVTLAYNACKTNRLDINVTSTELQEELDRNGQVTTVAVDGTDLKITFTNTKNEYIITQTGNVIAMAEKEKIVDGHVDPYCAILLTETGKVRALPVYTTTNRGTLTKINYFDTIPITDRGIRDIGYGYFLDNDGKIYRWGDNYSGKLGNGTTTDSLLPICISDIEGSALKGKNIIQTTGTKALDSDGKVYTWGNNEDGDLGDGTTTNSSLPICISDITGNALNGKIISEIGNGWALDNTGKLYTWGRNYDGELGNGTKTNSSLPVCISDITRNQLKDKTIIQIYKGESCNIAIDNNGKVYTWGNNVDGQLGNGTTIGSTTPICISEIEGSTLQNKNIIKIYNFGWGVLALDNNGKVYTWGNNVDGQLGNGTTIDSTTPICINDIAGSAIKDKKIVKVNTYDGDIIVLDSNGKVYTWGRNYSGELGNGTTTNSLLPICISDIEGSVLNGKMISDIIINKEGTISVKDINGTLYAWGNNKKGQLGDGTTTNSLMPKIVTVRLIENEEVIAYITNENEFYYYMNKAE